MGLVPCARIDTFSVCRYARAYARFLSHYAFKESEPPMCLAPVTLKNRTQVACRHCRVCRDNRVNDLIGRCIAEGTVAKGVFAVTLTYSGNGPETALLRYADIRNLLAYLRDDGHSIRFIVAGEFGSSKGRSHWHLVLFFRSPLPAVEMERRVQWKYWPHGFVYFQNPDYRGFKYVLKYALKDVNDKGQVLKLGMSKRPPLGHDYFLDLAERIVQAGLPLHSPEYAFSDVVDKNGVPRRYWLQGRMREIFLEYYCARWREVHLSEPPATDWLMERYLDPLARKQLDADPVRMERDMEARRNNWHDHVAARDAIEWWRERRELGILTLDARRYVVAWSTHQADLIEGYELWRVDGKGSAASVGVQLQALGLQPCEAQRVWRWLNVQWAKSDKLTPPPLRLSPSALDPSR